MNLTNNVVVVTGASRGIGEATARHLASLGAEVFLSARNTQSIEQIAASLRSDGQTAHALTCDVSDADQVKRLIEHVRRQNGSAGSSGQQCRCDRPDCPSRRQPSGRLGGALSMSI
ncbi:SDR family oxidoreductase [Devosia sp.]|uniref:SDR family NAD(P)-dependent oxidoreductase n=1 Tax=Devosia sp. TaxID=1871048 RepID=UPI0025F9D273|nr:SDR family NAD(P)-dependent oxidoreductase [Devosia sp.]MCR6633480.1 SDR family oxidoreductase [Devosia sp.]